MSEFEKQLHSMFDHIWECEIDHPAFQDTVGELMSAVIQCYNNLPSVQPEPCEDAVSREDVLEVNFLMPESELVFYDNDHGFCINTQDVLEHIERYVQQELNDE